VEGGVIEIQPTERLIMSDESPRIPRTGLQRSHNRYIQRLQLRGGALRDPQQVNVVLGGEIEYFGGPVSLEVVHEHDRLASSNVRHDSVSQDHNSTRAAHPPRWCPDPFLLRPINERDEGAVCLALLDKRRIQLAPRRGNYQDGCQGLLRAVLDVQVVIGCPCAEKKISKAVPTEGKTLRDRAGGDKRKKKLRVSKSIPWWHGP